MATKHPNRLWHILKVDIKYYFLSGSPDDEIIASVMLSWDPGDPEYIVVRQVLQFFLELQYVRDPFFRRCILRC